MRIRMSHRLRAFWQRHRQESELDEELRYHLELETARNIERGLEPGEARRAALRGFGNLDQIKEEARDARGTRPLEELLQDTKYAWRMLRGSPLFTLVAVLSLGLGIGANTAIFSVFDGLLLRRLQVPEPERLVYFRSFTPPARTTEELSFIQYQEFRERTDVFSELAASNTFDRSNIVISGPGGGQETGAARVALVSNSYFQVFGVQAARGRVLSSGSDQAWGAEPVAV